MACDRSLRVSLHVGFRTVAVMVLLFSIAPGLASYKQLAAQEGESQSRERTAAAPEGFTERAVRLLNDPSAEVMIGGIIRQGLGSVADSTLQFKNLDGAPVSIFGASAKFGAVTEGGKPVGYLVRPNVQLANNTDRRLIAV